MSNSRPVGRPTDYRDTYPEQVRKLCVLGATDKEIADFFDVDERTINRWKESHDEFCQSMKEGKIYANANVADSLYKRALGYSHEDVHVSNYQGDITLTPIVKHYPPDPTSGIFFLKNRERDKWRDKQDHEHSGPNGGAILVAAIDMTDEQLALIAASGIKKEKA